jgi:predicted amidohydrolase
MARGYLIEHAEPGGRAARPLATVRVGVAQAEVRLEDHVESAPGLLRLRRSAVPAALERLWRLVDRASVASVDVLLLPELAVDLGHPELAEAVATLARANGMIIVPGSFHDVERGANVARVYGPDGVLWEQEKNVPATLWLRGRRRFVEGIAPRAVHRVIVGRTRCGRIAVVVCRDFLDLDLRAALRHAEPPVDLVLNPALSPVTADFEAAHHDARRSIYAVLLFCNAAEFGRSGIFAPDRGRRRRPLPPGAEGLLWKDVDLRALRAARCAWRRRGAAVADGAFIQSTR